MTFSLTNKSWPNRRHAMLMLGAAGLPPLASNARAENAAGSVETLFGSAAVSRGTDSRGLSVGNALFVGDVVSTEVLSRLAMRLGTATKIRLGALTLLRIDRYLVEMGGTLSLGEGAILFDRPADAPESLTIRGEFGLIAVRGTRFFAGRSQGQIGVFVDRGAVTVTSGGVTVALETGEGTDLARRGDPPSAPRRWSLDRIESALSQVR